MKKKGVSQVVGTVMLILLTISLVGGMWVIVDNFVNKGLSDAEACYNLFEKVVLNQEYICYNSTSNMTMVSISRGEVELDSILILISDGETAKTITLTETFQNLPDVFNLSTTTPGVKMPGQEEGQTYCISGIENMPKKIEVAPKRKGKQCESIASTSKIIECTQAGC